MIKGLLRVFNPISRIISEGCRFRIPTKQERVFKELPLEDLMNEKYIRKLVRNRIPGSTMKAQRGLFHGKKVRTTHRITFSDKKTKLKQAPNVFKKSFHSSVLNKDIQVNVTSKTMRCIRKYGSFDNYILLTKSKNMQSNFGEYLRAIMLKKLNDPEIDFSRCNVFGASPNVWRRQKRRPKNDAVWLPKEIRHTDQTMNKFKGLNEMSKEQVKLVNEYIENPLRKDEIFKKYSKYDYEMKRIEDDQQKLKPFVDKVNKVIERKDKDKLRLFKYQIQDASKYIKNN